jgi:hypothetical protein
VIDSVVRALRDPLNQRVALTNAQQAAARLAYRRREREQVDAFLAQLAPQQGGRPRVASRRAR